jgi:hypothetical protein
MLKIFMRQCHFIESLKQFFKEYNQLPDICAATDLASCPAALQWEWAKVTLLLTNCLLNFFKL